jgi:enoyl-CoA hydratase
MTFETIRLDFEGALAIVTINRPKALNAINSQVIAELDQALTQVAGNESTRVLIVTGGGDKAFVAGADIAEMADFGPEAAEAFSRRGHQVFARLGALPIPTIAAINGFALGGGLEVALSCDLLYASEKAKLGLPEVSLAVLPGFGGTQRLSRLIGAMRARELVLTGDSIDAAKAKEIGLVLEVFPAEQLLSKCKDIAATIAARGPIAVAQAKRTIALGADLPLSEANSLESKAFGFVFGTADQKEGMKAFLEKRKASFQNR